MCVYNDYVVGGYGSGHIRVFNHQDGSLVAEITAHARWINALDVNPTGLVRWNVTLLFIISFLFFQPMYELLVYLFLFRSFRLIHQIIYL